MTTGSASELQYLRKRISELEKENQLLSRSNPRRVIPEEWANIPGVGTWTLHFGESLILASPEFFRVCGLPYTRDGWLPLSELLKCIHPDDQAFASDLHAKCLSGDFPYTGALRIVRDGDPEIRWVLVSGAVQRDKELRPVRLSGTIHDITALKATEEAFRIVEQRFRVVAQAAHQIIYTADEKGPSSEGVHFWKSLTGQSEAESAGLGWLNALHPDDRNRVESEWREATSTLAPFYSEYRVMTASGTEIHAGVRAIPLFEMDGRLREWVMGFTDLTERKLAAQALLESENRLRRTTEQFNLAALALGALIYDWDPATDVVERVRGLEELLGYRPEEVPATSAWWREQIHPDDRRPTGGLASYNPEVHGQLQVNEYRIRHRKGHYVSVRDSALFLVGEQGVQRVVGCTVDITQQKRAEEALHQQAEELARSNAELQQFAYAASHDLQEPLRAVSIYTDLLRRKYRERIDPTADQYIDYAVAGARRMESLLQGLLAYSRIGSVSDPVPVDANAVLDKVLFNLAERIRETGAEIRSDELPVVVADEVHVLQLLQNLIGNAVKYRSGERPCIRISVRRRERFFEFSIQDNGIGIAAEHQKQIFGMFRRLHSDGYEGTGIGLAICERIVQKYGGSIWVESHGEGAGSEFYFLLPAA
jgi:two-component system CheB/CheR fusion protein